MSKKDSRVYGIDRYHDIEPNSDTASHLKTIYSDWAETYDADNDHKLGTVSQPNTVAMLSRHVDRPDCEILDVGCGTGLVGKNLKERGYTTYDGTDVSSEMMQFAEPRGYRNLFPLEAGAPLPVANNAYDVALCVGVFTHEHLGPEGIDELLRVTKPSGHICFTVNEGVWQSAGFDRAIPAHSSQGNWQVLEQIKQDYMVNEGVQAWYIAAKKCG